MYVIYKELETGIVLYWTGILFINNKDEAKILKSRKLLEAELKKIKSEVKYKTIP